MKNPIHKFFSQPRTETEIEEVFRNFNPEAEYQNNAIANHVGLPADQLPAPVVDRRAVERSIIGETVGILNRTLEARRAAEAALAAEIIAKSEALRQQRAVIRSVESAMLQLIDDPALTDEERQILDALQAGVVTEALTVNG